jgi:stress response protein YsnF
MLRSIQSLRHSVVLATDGEIGKVEQFLFDDEKWSIRYLVVKTSWLLGRKVLVSPLAIQEMNGELHFIRLTLTKKQVEQSPDIDTDKPVSRQMETEFNDYYRWPYYWEGSGIWGVATLPAGMLGRPYVLPSQSRSEADYLDAATREGDQHLRAVHVVEGYQIVSKDDEFGHVDDFIFDDQNWAIRYLVVAARRIWNGKKVVLSPEWVKAISWSDRTITLGLTKEEILNSPEYHATDPVNREYEEKLYDYYGRPSYWSTIRHPKRSAK